MNQKAHASRASSRKAGFTLLEVLVAMAILGVGIMAVMGLFPASLRNARLAAERNSAANVAGSELSRLRALDNTGDMRAWLTNSSLNAVVAAGDAYAIYQEAKASVSRLPGSQNLIRVTYRVKMADGRHESFVTYVTER